MEMFYYSPDGDVFCEQCAPPGIEGECNSNETDCPDNCCVCGRPCKYTLTPHGVAYVLEYVREILASWPGDWMVINDHDHRPSYYVGSPRVEVVADWARDLRWYGLDDADKKDVDLLLELIAEAGEADTPAIKLAVGPE